MPGSEMADQIAKEASMYANISLQQKTKMHNNHWNRMKWTQKMGAGLGKHYKR